MKLTQWHDVQVMEDKDGQDTIGGGCGQLWFVQDWMKNNPDKARPSCGMGKNKVHIPIKQI
jgi:23S rRNA (adenine2503-C2)-methyltransferase